MSCSTGCQTKDHETYGACLRANAPRIAYANSSNGWDYSKQKRFDQENAAYRQAKADGLQPANVTFDAIHAAYDAAS